MELYPVILLEIVLAFIGVVDDLVVYCAVVFYYLVDEGLV